MSSSVRPRSSGANLAAGPQRASNIPRLSTNVDKTRSPSSPLTATPDTPEAHDFYRQRQTSHTGYRPTTASNSFDVANIRSRTNSPDNSPRTARSNPALASRIPGKRSVRDLANRFEPQNDTSIQPPIRPTGYRSVSTPKAAASRASSTSIPHPSGTNSPVQRFRRPSVQRKSSDRDKPKRSPEDDVSPSSILLTPQELEAVPQPTVVEDGKKLLFGEVSVTLNAPLPGHGIPRRPNRRISDGSMHLSNIQAHRPNLLDLTFPQDIGHRRSRTQNDLGFEQAQMDVSPLESTASPLTLNALRNALPRPLFTDLRESRRSQARGDTQASSSFPSSNDHHRSLTPPSPESFRPLELGAQPETRLKASIREPSPKKSPSLRSSRPRQNISSMSQAGSAPSSNDRGSPERRIPGAFRNSIFDDNDGDDDYHHFANGSRDTINPVGDDVSREVRDEKAPTVGYQLTSDTYKKPPPPYLTVATSKSRHSRAPTPGSTTDFEENGTDFEEDTPLSATKPNFIIERSTAENLPLETSFSPQNFERDAQDALCAEPSSVPKPLSVVTNTVSRRPEPQLIHGAARPSPALSPDDEEAGTIPIMLGTTPALGNTSWTGDELQVKPTPLSTSAGQADELFPRQPHDSFLSPQPPSKSNSIKSYGYTPDSDSGYNPVHQFLQEYLDEPGSVSPFAVEQFISEHKFTREGFDHLLKEQALSRKASLASRAPQSPAEIPPLPDSLPPSVSNSNKFHQDFNSGRHQRDSFLPESRSAPPSTRIGSEDETSSTVTPAQQRFSSQTIKSFVSEQPSLPEIQDTGGGLGLFSQDGSRISPLLPPGHGSGFSRSTQSSLTSQQPPSSTFSRSRDSQQAAAGARETIESPPTTASRPYSLRSTESSLHTPSDDTMAAASSSSGMPIPTTSSTAATSTDDLQKKLKQRQNVVKELIDTEYGHHQDMTVLEDIYLATASSCQQLSREEIRKLFTNTKAVRQLSLELADRLKEATRGIYTAPKNLHAENRTSAMEQRMIDNLQHREEASQAKDLMEADRETYVGMVLLHYLDRIEDVYLYTIKNFKAASDLYQKLQEREQVRLWLHECGEYAKDLTFAWDFTSLATKPFQRVTKYPLLIKEVLKATPDDHPDYLQLVQAAEKYPAAIARINEAERRSSQLAELIEAVGGPAGAASRTFISKLTKQFSQWKLNSGQTQEWHDPEYEHCRALFNEKFAKFNVVMDGFKSFEQHTEDFMKQWLEVVKAFEDAADIKPSRHPEMESKWHQYGMVVRELAAIGFRDYLMAVHLRCVVKMNEVKERWEKARALCHLRKDFLPIYSRYQQQKVKKGDASIDAKLKWYAERFESLTALLKDEIPKLAGLSRVVMLQSMDRFFQLNAGWYATCEEKISTVLDEPLERWGDWQHIVRMQRANFNPVVYQLETLRIINQRMLADTADVYANHVEGTPTGTPRAASRASPEDARAGSIASQGSLPGPPFPGRNRRSTETGRSSFLDGPTPPAQAQEGNNYVAAGGQIYTQQSAFNSALPMGSPAAAPRQSKSVLTGGQEYKVLFLAASLFDFAIERTRQEAGFPYLQYNPGEIFDVIGERGELWLARNQEDPGGTIGWIWEKHFAKIPNDEDESP